MSIPLFCRITTDVSPTEILTILRLCPRYEKIIVSQENDANRTHVHCFIMTVETTAKNARQNLRNLIKKAFPQFHGNSSFSITEVKTEYSKLQSYVVKEGNFVYYGFTPEEIQTFVEKSFNKKKVKDSYKNELQSLEESHTDIEDFINKYLDLRFKYNKQITYFQALNYIQWIMIKHSKDNLFKFKQRLAVDLRLDVFGNNNLD